VHMPRFICGEVSPTSPENAMENAPCRGIALDMAWISHHRLCLVGVDDRAAVGGAVEREPAVSTRSDAPWCLQADDREPRVEAAGHLVSFTPAR
jgi:hypothetical protein